MDYEAVRRRAIEVFGSEAKAEGWMREPHRLLGLRRPIDVIGTPDGTEEVITILGRIEYGVFS